MLKEYHELTQQSESHSSSTHAVQGLLAFSEPKKNDKTKINTEYVRSFLSKMMGENYIWDHLFPSQQAESLSEVECAVNWAYQLCI